MRAISMVKHHRSIRQQHRRRIPGQRVSHAIRTCFITYCCDSLLFQPGPIHTPAAQDENATAVVACSVTLEIRHKEQQVASIWSKDYMRIGCWTTDCNTPPLEWPCRRCCNCVHDVPMSV